MPALRMDVVSPDHQKARDVLEVQEPLLAPPEARQGRGAHVWRRIGDAGSGDVHYHDTHHLYPLGEKPMRPTTTS